MTENRLRHYLKKFKKSQQKISDKSFVKVPLDEFSNWKQTLSTYPFIDDLCRQNYATCDAIIMKATDKQFALLFPNGDTVDFDYERIGTRQTSILKKRLASAFHNEKLKMQEALGVIKFFYEDNTFSSICREYTRGHPDVTKNLTKDNGEWRLHTSHRDTFFDYHAKQTLPKTKS